MHATEIQFFAMINCQYSNSKATKFKRGFLSKPQKLTYILHSWVCFMEHFSVISMKVIGNFIVLCDLN